MQPHRLEVTPVDVVYYQRRCSGTDPVTVNNNYFKITVCGGASKYVGHQTHTKDDGVVSTQ